MANGANHSMNIHWEPIVLHENNILDDISVLDRAWTAPQTFVLLPEKTDVSLEWIQQGMQVPESMEEGHFALLTSGSTGQPKLVMGSRRRAERLARTLHVLQDSESVQQTVLALPLSYCYAFVNQWLWSRVSKRRIVVTRGFRQPKQLLRALSEVEQCMLCLVGAQIPLFVGHFGDVVFPGIIRLHFAGGPFPQHDIDTVKKFFPNARIFNNYGCAEAMPRLSIRPVEDSDEGSNIGKPLPGVELKTDENGQILFRSRYGAVGIYEQGQFQQIQSSDWVASGDFGEEIGNEYWRITGRANEVFKRFGEKISLPRLLESVHTHWDHEAAFFREKDPSGEESHVLVVAPQPDETQLRAILSGFRHKHPRTHWPIRVESLNRMPLLPNGKVDVLGLREATSKTVHWRQRI